MSYKKNGILLYACIERNIGDDLFIQTICNRYPEKCFIISSKAKYGSLLNVKNLKFSKVLECWMILDAISQEKKAKKIIANYIKKILQLFLGNYDIGVYIVGNAFKNKNYQGKEQLQWLVNRAKLTKEFYLISTNFGPFNDKRWIDDAKNIFSELKDICFRDIQSYDLFADLPNVRYAPDAILSLGKQKSKKNKMKVLISIIDCSFYARENWLKKQTNNYENKIFEIIKEFENLGYEIVLINSNAVQDGPASRRIFEKCNSPSVSIYDYDGDLDELLTLYEEAMYVIGTRLHTIVLAWLYELPVFPFIYDIKVENMLKSYSYKGGYAHIKDVDQLDVSTVFEILENGKCKIDEKIISDANLQFLALDERVNNE